MPDNGNTPTISRRAFVGIVGGVAAGGAATAQLDDSGGEGVLSGGYAALDRAYRVEGTNMWVGPDNARSEVAANTGRMYIGVTGSGYTFYHGDDGSWVTKGLGDEQNPVSSIHSESVSTEEVVIGGNGNVQWVFSDGSATDEHIHAAFDALPSGREYQGEVYLLGKFNINKWVHPPSYTYINGRNALFVPGPDLDANSYLFDMKTERDGTLLDPTQAKQQVFVDGLYANGQNNVDYNGIRFFGSGAGGAPQHYNEFRHGARNIMVRNVANHVAVNIGTRRGYFEHISVADCDCNGIRLGPGSGDVYVVDAHAEECSGWGISLERGFQHLEHPIAQKCDVGIVVDAHNETKIIGGMTEFNDNEGMTVSAGTQEFYCQNLSILANGQENNSPGVVWNASESRMNHCTFRDDQDTPTQTLGIELTGDANANKLSDNITDNQPGHGSPNDDWWVDNGSRNIINGRVTSPETKVVSDGSHVNGYELPVETIPIYITGGGSDAALTGVNRVDDLGRRLRLIHTGSDTLTLQDISTSGASANGFKNQGGTDITLAANEEMAEYVYDGDHWREAWSNTA